MTSLYCYGDITYEQHIHLDEYENSNDSKLTLKELMINSLENEYSKSLWNETISEINNITKIN